MKRFGLGFVALLGWWEDDEWGRRSISASALPCSDSIAILLCKTPSSFSLFSCFLLTPNFLNMKLFYSTLI